MSLSNPEEPQILELIREAVIAEQREKMHAPQEAKAEADRRIKAATTRKLVLIRNAADLGVTKSALASCIGIRNIGQVSKLIERAKELNEDGQ